MQEQKREQRARFRRGKRNDTVSPDRLERPEDPELHMCSLSLSPAATNAAPALYRSSTGDRDRRPMSTDARTLEEPAKRRLRLRRRPLLLICAAVAALATGWSVTHSASSRHTTATFEYDATPVTYVVPAGVCRIRIEADGAAGGGAGTAGSQAPVPVRS